MSRYLVAAVAACAVVMSWTGAAGATLPPDRPAPPLVTPPADSPGARASVLHCNAIEGGSGVAVVNPNHDDLGNCDLGG